jgi:hypothetical protein
MGILQLFWENMAMWTDTRKESAVNYFKIVAKHFSVEKERNTRIILRITGFLALPNMRDIK